jgi:hypothetical protein
LNKRGFCINMTGVLWLSGLLADHWRTYSVSRGPARHRNPTQIPQNWSDRGIIPACTITFRIKHRGCNDEKHSKPGAIGCCLSDGNNDAVVVRELR